MKQIILAATALLFTVGCSTNVVNKTSSDTLGKKHPEWAKGAVMYELNTRQLTPQGTFAAATEELPRIAELGVDIIWVMPIQPIGKLNRKGSLGSYYAISDYTAFNPEFGTRDNFETFVDRAHQLGMRVILDWVANHTSPDHSWTKNEGWHMRDSLGNLCVQYDWTDIAELNYDNADMREQMIRSMKFWVDSIGVDGFRCDMAMLVPTDFWETAIDELQKSNPDLFMLSEAEEVDLTNKAFDAYYGWELHHILNALAQGKVTADSLGRYLEKAEQKFPASALRLNFTSNHDENSWAGTEQERMGAAVSQMAVLTHLLPGTPLIYTGQETGNNHRLLFFEKDTIDRVVGAPQTLLYRALGEFRDEHPALRNGALNILKTDRPSEVFAMQRSEGSDRVVGVFNFSSDTVTVNVEAPDHKMCVVPTGIMSSPTQKMKLQPFEYRIFYN